MYLYFRYPPSKVENAYECEEEQIGQWTIIEQAVLEELTVAELDPLLPSLTDKNLSLRKDMPAQPSTFANQVQYSMLNLTPPSYHALPSTELFEPSPNEYYNIYLSFFLPL